MQQHWLTNLPIHGVMKTEPLLRGVANDVYKITTTSGVYVLKHFRFDHPYGLDRDQEVNVQQQLAEHGIAPQILHYDSAQGLLLQTFIEAPDLAHDRKSMGTKIQRLGEVSAHIHRLQVDVPVWSLRTRLQRYCDNLAEYEPDRARQFQKRLQQQRKLIDSFGKNAVFCHNDLAFHHVFLAQQPIVIDWEYAGLGDRYFDLANAIQVNQLEFAERRAFINAYEGASGEQIDSDKLAQWLELSNIISQLWYELHHHLQHHHV